MSNLMNIWPVGVPAGSNQRKLVAFQYCSPAVQSPCFISSWPFFRVTTASPYRLSPYVPTNAVSGTGGVAFAAPGADEHLGRVRLAQRRRAEKPLAVHDAVVQLEAKPLRHIHGVRENRARGCDVVAVEGTLRERCVVLY